MRRIAELTVDAGIRDPIEIRKSPLGPGKKRVNILALGDVGMTMLIGLRLLGKDQIREIGICDINKENVKRLEMEINQIREPSLEDGMPKVVPVEEGKLFDCDVFIFCASRGVPGLDAEGDVRMAQLAANREIIRHYGGLARSQSFRGLVAVVSDPVDPLCKAFLQESGLAPWQVQGYGLGVMNARAAYFAERDPALSSYLTEGRVYGPHGEDLVVANSVENYDQAISEELTRLTVTANLAVRELGYKPYIAPAMSSAALSILATMRGEWHYGSLYFGSGSSGAFLGIRNRMTDEGIEYEDVLLPEELYQRIRKAYDNLCRL